MIRVAVWLVGLAASVLLLVLMLALALKAVRALAAVVKATLSVSGSVALPVMAFLEAVLTADVGPWLLDLLKLMAVGAAFLMLVCMPLMLLFSR